MKCMSFTLGGNFCEMYVIYWGRLCVIYWLRDVCELLCVNCCDCV